MLSGDREKRLRITGWLIHLTGFFGIVIFVGLYQVVVSALIAHEKQEIASEASEKEQFLTRSDEITGEHKQLTEQLERLEKNAVTMRFRIPEHPREAEFLKQVSQVADEEGLKIHKYERGSLDRKSTHTEFNVKLSCEGEYFAIVGFLDRLAKLPRVTTVQSMTLTAGTTTKYPVDLSLLLYYGAQAAEEKAP
jgi:type IV pilus assembly protein PilO